MKIIPLRFLFCAFVATALSVSAFAQAVAGTIQAARVQGAVVRIAADGTQSPLKNGDVLKQSDAVSTGKDSGVILAFANGSTVKLGAESRLAIEEFMIDPFAEEVKVSELKAEPSSSRTTLNLSYGELVGDVKKLNTSSSYSIKTPVGAAGIRGTIYRIVFRPASDGKAFFTVQTLEGQVVMQGVTNAEVPVPAGKEVVVEVDPANPSPVIVTQDLSETTQALIRTESSAILETVETVVIPPPAPGNSQASPPAPPPPPPLPPLVDPTSGAGQQSAPPT